MQKIVIVDYGMGNLFSVQKKFNQLGALVVCSDSPRDILTADKIILPGVGHFGAAMNQLEERQLIEALNIKVQQHKTPILGICLGMQLMCKFSEEGNVPGLGWINAEVRRLKVNDTLRYKVPHTGWNQIDIVKYNPLYQHIEQHSEFYFVHSYHVVCSDRATIGDQTTYESVITSGIHQGNIYGVQYHPEKSHAVGNQLLKNFLAL